MEAISVRRAFWFFFLTVTLALLLHAGPALALVIEYTFEGSINQTETNLVPIGTLFSGSFSIDLSAPSVTRGDASVRYYQALCGFQMIIGTDSLYGHVPWIIGVGSAGWVLMEDIYGDFLGHASDSFLSFYSDYSFTDVSLLNAINLAQFSGTFAAQIFGLEGRYITEIRGDIGSVNQVSPVPEPSSMLLLGTGLVGLLGYRKRIKVQPLIYSRVDEGSYLPSPPTDPDVRD